MATKKLVSDSGVDSVTFGTQTYTIRDGFVTVPVEAVDGLLSTGGFVIAQEQHDVSGLVPLINDDKGASASWGGKTVSADEDGIWHAPAEAVADLLAHGYRPVTILEQVETEAEKAAAKKAADDKAAADKAAADKAAADKAAADKKAADDKAAADKKAADDKAAADKEAADKAAADKAAADAAEAAKNGGLTVVEPGTSTPKKS